MGRQISILLFARLEPPRDSTGWRATPQSSVSWSVIKAASHGLFLAYGRRWSSIRLGYSALLFHATVPFFPLHIFLMGCFVLSLPLVESSSFSFPREWPLLVVLRPGGKQDMHARAASPPVIWRSRGLAATGAFTRAVCPVALPQYWLPREELYASRWEGAFFLQLSENPSARARRHIIEHVASKRTDASRAAGTNIGGVLSFRFCPFANVVLLLPAFRVPLHLFSQISSFAKRSCCPRTVWRSCHFPYACNCTHIKIAIRQICLSGRFYSTSQANIQRHWSSLNVNYDAQLNFPHFSHSHAMPNCRHCASDRLSV